jgi:hypothetical protein
MTYERMLSTTSVGRSRKLCSVSIVHTVGEERNEESVRQLCATVLGEMIRAAPVGIAACFIFDPASGKWLGDSSSIILG